jgi:cell wall-associated NlpC family hydrolase
MNGAALAAAAAALAGTPFRLHGRDPAIGLDCIGLLGAALTGIGRPAWLPTGYALRNSTVPAFAPHAERLGFGSASGEACAGDVQVFAVGPAQLHLAIAVDEGAWAHAHAGLRRVVVGPVPGEWRPIGRWRLLPLSTG